jgi:hypothetical protein
MAPLSCKKLIVAAGEAGPKTKNRASTAKDATGAKEKQKNIPAGTPGNSNLRNTQPQPKAIAKDAAEKLSGQKNSRIPSGVSFTPKEKTRNADLDREVPMVAVPGIRLPRGPQERPER